jgi:hypothetical protein
MARYEVTVRSTLCFSTEPYSVELAVAEQVSILFDGREFVWHANTEPTQHGVLWPSVTVMVADGNDYDAEKLATRRFLSALSFAYDTAMGEIDSGASGYKQRLDPPLVISPGRHLAGMVHDAPSELIVAGDNRLRLTLALAREGVSSDSPFYRFLAIYNALDAAFDNDEALRDQFILHGLANERLPATASPPDWAAYLRDSNRNAIAHAVRVLGKPTLDPDEPTDRDRLAADNRLLIRLVHDRVNQRWPGGVKVVRRSTP